MPLLLPFRAYRPPRDKAHLVASRSYITYSKAELEEKLVGNPFTFLHVINPEASEGNSPTKNTRERFGKVGEKFQEWFRKGYFIQDEESSYYIYRQSQPDHVFTGVIGCTSVEDYKNGRIKIHEQTLTDREEIFKEYLDQTNFHAEPVLLTYPDLPELNALISELCSYAPSFDFSTTDMIRHTLWKVDDLPALVAIKSCFDKIPDFYIADGHHRSASSLRLQELRQEESGVQDPLEASNFFMSCLIPKSELHIEPFHRMIRKETVIEPDFLLKLEDKFIVTAVSGSADAKPRCKHEFGLFLDNRWFHLKLKKEIKSSSPVDHLDPQILTDEVLNPLLGITDLKTDQRILCVGGRGGAEGIEKLVAKGGFRMGFWLFPVAVEEVMMIADHNLIMPPKSTWVEPKLRSGLTVFTFPVGTTLENPAP